MSHFWMDRIHNSNISMLLTLTNVLSEMEPLHLGTSVHAMKVCVDKLKGISDEHQQISDPFWPIH